MILANQKVFVIHVLADLKSRAFPILAQKLVSAQKFVEMEKDLNSNAMMEIKETEMDVMLTVKLKKDGTAKVDLAQNLAHVFHLNQTEHMFLQQVLFICSAELFKVLGLAIFLLN